MPRENYYAGMTLDEALARMAEFHFDPDTRHISAYEHELLLRAIEALQHQHDAA